MGVLTIILKLLTLIGEGFIKFKQERVDAQVRLDGRNAEKLKQIQGAQNVEKRARQAEGAIEEASHIDNDTTTRSLRDRKF
jgi:hypothetical protein